MGSSGTAAWEQRWHPLREEWVVVAAHRQDRPWQGERRSTSASGGASIRRELLLLSAQRPRERRAESRLRVDLRVRQRSPCVGADAPRELEPPPGIYRNAPATGFARVVCYTPRHDLTLAELTIDEIVALLEAWRDQYLELGAHARGQSRAHLREQRRSRRRLEPASPLPDLRDQLRLQDDRDRGRRQPAILRRTRPRAVPGHPRSEQEDGRRILFENDVGDRVRPLLRAVCLRVLRRAEGDAREHGHAVERRAAATWRRRSSRCWCASTICGRCRFRT